jgi:UDP-glucose 4-epimerase
VAGARLRVVVTGGAGFIGSHTARLFKSNDWDVVVVDDLSGGNPNAVPAGVPIAVVDVGTEEVVGAIVGHHPNVVLHAAAQVSVARSMADPDEDFRTNVLGTKFVLEAARQSGARLVFVSSGGAIYGDADGADESFLPAPKSYYGVHKYLAERYAELSGVDFAVARLSNVYGPGQRAGLEGGVVAIFAEALQAGRAITIDGGGEQRRDFVHVADVARALVDLSEFDGRGVWNVGSGTSVSIGELLAVLEAEFGSARELHHGPSRPGDVFHSRLRIDRIAADVGWAPEIALEVGVRDLRDQTSVSA